MFTFKLSNLEELFFNYPKYMIVLKNLNSHYFHDNSMFYYLVSTIKNYTSTPCKFPTYMIMPYLYFDIRNKKDDKFNLSKLGTDYVVNDICIHYREECIGSYPDNYIFVNEPDWPTIEDRVDKTPLKCSYRSKEN